MFYGVYKSVSSPEEFFAEPREENNYPSQVEYDGSRYSLARTIIVSSQSLRDKLLAEAERLGVKYDVKIN